jgi:protein-tyrosine-phosphatase
VVSIDDHGTNRIAAAVRALGIPPKRHVAWKISDPWGGDHSEYEASALAIVKALAQLRKHVEQAQPSA